MHIEQILLIVLAAVCVVTTTELVITLSRMCDRTDRKRRQQLFTSPWKRLTDTELTMDRVAIAYDTHDDRKVRYAFGRFQFNGGKLVGFWKDGNEQPKQVKTKDIICWMRIPELPQQEEEKPKER